MSSSSLGSYEQYGSKLSHVITPFFRYCQDFIIYSSISCKNSITTIIRKV